MQHVHNQNQKGMDFASYFALIVYSIPRTKESLFPMKPLHPQTNSNSLESGMTLETIISVGVLGWLAMGMVLMGLGIW